MKKVIRDFRYDASGLKNIVLKNMEIFVCVKCAEEETVIPNMQQLHDLIAFHIASQPLRLLPEEIRFLRSHLGFSGVDFARAIDVTPESVSRWETGKEKMSLSLERFLRTLVLYHCKTYKDYALDLTHYGNLSKAKPAKKIFVAKGKDWKKAA
ncbi:MAG: hypothetical protein HY877_04785 [Deltaproteobacteria bacterium]|nr:hypothetical protein [Deltaproteobacteria bacterium]